MALATAAGWGRGLFTLVRITVMAFRHPWQAGFAIGATLIASTFQLMIPRLLGQAVDHTQMAMGGGTAGQAAQDALLTTALLLLGASVLRGLFTMVQNYFSESVGHHMGYELRLACYEKIQRLSFSFHDTVHSGDLITVGMLDLEGVRMYFSTALVRMILLTILIGIGAYMLLSTDVVLGLLALSFVPFVGWRSSVTQLRLRATWLDLQERLSVLTRIMEENLGGIRVVRAFAAQEHELSKFEAASKNALALAHQRVGIRVVNTSAMTFSFFAAMGLVLWIGGGKVMSGEITVGTLASFLTFMTILQMPVRQLGLMVNAFARASTCGSRLFNLLDLDIAIKDAPDAKELAVSEGVLRFENVSFAYPGSEKRTVLHDVSFEARRGQTIGIVGPPGSGKSTIAHLIPRFYDVSGGKITIDGQDIRKATLQSLRRAVAVVQQDSFLFTTTIENNIAYGDPWAKESRIERASESAQLHNYVLGLPTGYGTVVGERGVSLSGGQRQRLSIARALMLKPAVMVFDDSTAAIDAATEQRIRSAMRRYAADRVTIIVAHRLSSLMHADQILFAEDGRIVERGTHQALLSLGGRYKALYDLQVRPGDEVLSA
ncbi:multidrug ABC transporter ATP-binding/permease protein (plasmid) [Rhizobium phaseoli]|uniref:ABC transporter ATP-binding protein n=1 Tax=Rhizobium phaseoli TaxID=396 RepID=A0A192TIJ2_9HYPH|nr:MULTISPECIES: ABC transporter ATP-binding protein [Rhizobium]ANL30672.1 multidrug ABC transporter ATP-binding/permease protein [Rhizobium phaseoli]ANL56101.1 multidrug ABC transporter ATP-binding/permease protein [Rhizobium phaseoli]ANL87501.1 multidrug ABC transporter ATP-binding/permease protein [Rhizobium phaseoli]ANL94010.1 multidrug ABC transporter ATP-binding/permease protein [Rhizobium phaseoli]MDE8758620.1 ABC transporter ATP-binding protein [Rhizobium sp. CBK13]